MFDYLIVGAGFAGAVIAERLASCSNKKVLVVESRHHIGGNTYDYYNDDGILAHKYGPHIFHTSNEKVWSYIQQFGEFMPFVNRVKTITGGRVFSLPINLLTINQFFGKTFNPSEAEAFLASKP